MADLGAGVFLFDHSTWGWKYLDLDQDGITLAVGQEFTNLPSQEGTMQVYGSVLGNTLSLDAVDDRIESPELTLTAGTAYSFSIWARTGFNQTGSVDCQLTTAAGAYTNTIGTASLTGADSTYTKYSFDIVAPSTQTDYKIRYNKTAAGFILLDLFFIQKDVIYPNIILGYWPLGRSAQVLIRIPSLFSSQLFSSLE